MTKNSFLIFLVIFLCSEELFSQELKNGGTIRKHSLFLEIGGNGVFYSINYDALFLLSTNFGFSVRAGFSIAPPFLTGSDWGLTIPAEFNVLLGKTKNFFEFGVGSTLIRSFAGRNTEFPLVGRLGYRYQKTDGGLFFRIGINGILTKDYSGVYNDLITKRFIPWAGISIGLTFKNRKNDNN